MAVATNIRVIPSPRTATGHYCGPAVPRPLTRHPVPAATRRPAPLVAAPLRVAARPCAPRPIAGSVGWLVLLAGLTFLVVLGIGWSTGGQDTDSIPNATQVVQVHPGDTLWSVAERMAPAAAPVAVVDRIRQLNGLDEDSTVYPGELLQVPSNLSMAAGAQAGAIQH
jgi:LysM domain